MQNSVHKRKASLLYLELEYSVEFDTIRQIKLQILSEYIINFKNVNLGSQIILNSILEFSHNSNFQNNYESKLFTQNVGMQ